MNVLRNRRWGTCGACREDVKFQNFVKKVQEFLFGLLIINIINCEKESKSIQIVPQSWKTKKDKVLSLTYRDIKVPGALTFRSFYRGGATLCTCYLYNIGCNMISNQHTLQLRVSARVLPKKPDDDIKPIHNSQIPVFSHCCSLISFLRNLPGNSCDGHPILLSSGSGAFGELGRCTHSSRIIIRIYLRIETCLLYLFLWIPLGIVDSNSIQIPLLLCGANRKVLAVQPVALVVAWNDAASVLDVDRLAAVGTSRPNTLCSHGPGMCIWQQILSTYMNGSCLWDLAKYSIHGVEWWDTLECMALAGCLSLKMLTSAKISGIFCLLQDCNKDVWDMTKDDQQLRCEGDLQTQRVWMMCSIWSLLLISYQIKPNFLGGKSITRIIHFLASHDEAIYDAGRPQVDW